MKSQKYSLDNEPDTKGKPFNAFFVKRGKKFQEKKIKSRHIAIKLFVVKFMILLVERMGTYFANDKHASFFLSLLVSKIYLEYKRRYDIQHNDTEHNDTQHNDTQHNDSQHYDTQHYDTRDYDTQHNGTQHNKK